MTDEKDQDAWAQSRGHRLPNLMEVLTRRTTSPVDLYMFYLFVQRERNEDVLDFYLDVQHHENLCRAYFKDLRKSGRSLKDDWPQFWEYARRRGSIYGTVIDASMKRSPGSFGDDDEKWGKARDDHLGGSTGPYGPRPSTSMAGHGEKEGERSRSGTPFSLSGRSALGISLGHKRASRAPTIIPRSKAITRLDLVASAERIFFRYLSPPPPGQDSHEIYLPPTLRIHSFPLSSTALPKPDSPDYEAEMNALAQIPDMFHAQQEYCFRAMEQDVFPRFLRAKAYGNLTSVSASVRLVVGLLILWAGLSAAFSLIFLDVHPKSKRFFLFIPFTLATLFLVSHQYALDPILIFFNQSETTPFRTTPLRDPYVKKMLRVRAIWVMVLILGIDAALTLMFWAVPGHRL
ncbi:hypothetical protein SISNIDRAFT_416710 [Sistotremastrum niveocremeum HHB9708]|uniref:RGS domain-containing protein n=1 Tax=Sistotremastrum niveocremeum HHB9708 TaxID=1314777 RepID=A0A164QI19_9AGAM|nr:hypothetical protein SISNIDRAFT_416710 [Sistotremastrum niveocremeum HHB9708]